MRKQRTQELRQKRTDQEWVDELSGHYGSDVQAQTIDELARYLFVVVYNDLRGRQAHGARLGQLDNEELYQLAQDFSQQFMEKVVAHNFALLQKYHAKGNFTAWASKVALNIVRSELRRARWSNDSLIHAQINDPNMSILPDVAVLNGQIYEALQRSMEQLPAQMRDVFVRSVIENEQASVIAEELGVTANTIYLMVFRARKKIRRLMKNDGYALQDLAF